MDDKYLKALHGQANAGFDLGTYDEFKKNMETDSKFRKAFHEAAGSDLDLGEYSDFENNLGLKKKGSTPSTSSVGKSVSQNQGIDIGEQIKKATSGPQDFVQPEGFTIGQQGKVIPAGQEKAIKFAGAQMQAQQVIKDKGKKLEQTAFDLEADKFTIDILNKQIKEAEAQGNQQAYTDIATTYNNIVNRYNKTAEEANADQEEIRRAANANDKIQNYFNITNNLNRMKSDLAEMQKTKFDKTIETTTELGAQVYNGIVPVLVSATGILTKDVGAILDEMRGDPSGFDTLGDLIVSAGQSIQDGSKKLKLPVSEAAQKSLFEGEGYKDPRAWANTMVSGVSSSISMGAGQMVGIPMWVTGTAMAADGLYQAAEEAGIENEKDRLLFATTVAPFVGALESMGGSSYVKGFMNKLTGKAVKEVLLNLPKEALTPKMVMDAFGNALVQKGTSIAKSIGEEMLTGAGEQASQVIGETIYDLTGGEGKAKGKGAFGRNIGEAGYIETALMDIAKGGVEEGVGALLPIGISGGKVSNGKIALAQDLFEAKKNPEVMNKWYDMIEIASQDGTITPEQAEVYTERLNKLGAVDSRIPANVSNPEARAQAIEIVQELEVKREEIEQAEPAFQPLLEEEAKEMEKRLQEIAKSNEPQYGEKDDATGSYIHETEDNIELIGLHVPEEKRNQGTGTKFLTDLKEKADKTGKTITVKATEEFGGDINKLREFYPRNGFTPMGNDVFVYTPPSKQKTEPKDPVKEDKAEKSEADQEIQQVIALNEKHKNIANQIRTKIQELFDRGVNSRDIMTHPEMTTLQQEFDSVGDEMKKITDKPKQETPKSKPEKEGMSAGQLDAVKALEAGQRVFAVNEQDGHLVEFKSAEEINSDDFNSYGDVEIINNEDVPEDANIIPLSELKKQKSPKKESVSNYKKGEEVVFEGQKRVVKSVTKIGNENKYEIDLGDGKSIWTNESFLNKENKTKGAEVGKQEIPQAKTPKSKVGSKTYPASKKAEGRERSITIADGTKIKGKYKVVSADDVLASHNEQSFAKSEGFPTNEQGKTVNDRDYENDKAAQGEVVRIAGKLDSRALSQTPIVTKDGIVVDGNNRTMSRKLAAKQGTDAEYIAALEADADMYGIDPEEIKGVKNPMLVFEADQDIPYTTKEFARFNKAEKKEKSPIEKAVELSKTISDRSRRILANIYEQAERPSDVTSNVGSMTTIRDLLLSEGIVQPNELPRYINPETGTATKEGVAFLETLLIGSSLDENTIRLLNSDGMGSAKNRVLESVVQIAQNAALGENSLQSNIENGVKLLQQANSTKQSVLEAVSQMGMFEVSEYSAEDIAVAILLDGSGFKSFLKNYNQDVGTESIFEGTITKEKIIDNLLSQKVKNYEQVRKNLRGDEAGRQAEVREGDGGVEPEKPAGEEERKQIAKRIRNKKTGGAMSAIDFGLTVGIYNGALEFMAGQVERGTKLGNAIANTMKWIDQKMEGKKWNKGGFAKYMNDQYKVKMGDKVVEVLRDDTKETAEIINGFYSPLEQKILDTKQESLPANKWAEILKSKEDEDLYTGVREFLESKGKESVSKKELKDFMKNNRIEIVEVVKGGKKAMSKQQAKKVFEEQGYDVVTDNNGDTYVEKEDELFEYENMSEQEKIAFDILTANNLDRINTEGDTKYQQYQLPGEKENYREVLITLPKKSNWKIKKDQYGVWVADFGNEHIEGESREDVERQIKKYDEVKSRNMSDQFKSSHFNEPNILVHLRMNERTDSEGNKVLFLEEVQSDWGQKGKREGFDNKELEKKRNDLLDELRFIERQEGDNIIVKKVGNTGNLSDFETSYKDENLKNKLESKRNQIQSKINEINSKTGITPEAPFITDTNSWVKLGLKYALKQAVESGADKIAWTTGEQQNERYDLSKQVNKIDIEHIEEEEGVYFVDLFLSSGEDANLEVENGVVRSGEYKGQKLEDIVGKEYAEKILSTPRGQAVSLTGQDLKLGGKGMKGFYDNIVPSVAKSLIQDLTGEEGVVGASELGGQKGEIDRVQALKLVNENKQVFTNLRGKEYQLYNVGDVMEADNYFVKDSESQGQTTQQSIEITPELKKSVQEGMPLFSGAKPRPQAKSIAGTDVSVEGAKIDDYLEALNKVESARSNMAKEAHQRTLSEIEATMPQDFIKKAKFVKENLAEIRKEMEKKGILKVEC